MGKKYLEITYSTRERVGYYKDEAGESLFTILRWHKKEGDILSGVEDPNTGTVHGDPVLDINAAKGEKTIEAVDWEIGARIVEILLPAGEKIFHDLSEEPLRLALLEVLEDVGKGAELPKEVPPQPTDQKPKDPP